MEIKQFRYNELAESDKILLTDLLTCIWHDDGGEEIHPKEMNAMSFCAIENNKYVGYAGVIEWGIEVQGESFRMCGLSCVCTHPYYRKRGMATALVRKATEWIMRSKVFDIGFFTCSPQHTSFYKQVGCWKIAPDIILKEGDREGAHRSDLHHLDVFKLIISQKAKLYADCFENTTINLNFPTGKFI